MPFVAAPQPSPPVGAADVGRVILVAPSRFDSMPVDHTMPAAPWKDASPPLPPMLGPLLAEAPLQQRRRSAAARPWQTRHPSSPVHPHRRHLPRASETQSPSRSRSQTLRRCSRSALPHSYQGHQGRRESQARAKAVDNWLAKRLAYFEVLESPDDSALSDCTIHHEEIEDDVESIASLWLLGELRNAPLAARVLAATLALRGVAADRAS
jgi:hypothetical protein